MVSFYFQTMLAPPSPLSPADLLLDSLSAVGHVSIEKKRVAEDVNNFTMLMLRLRSIMKNTLF